VKGGQRIYRKSPARADLSLDTSKKSRQMVSTTYDSLRGLILAGALQPEQFLSQVQLARQLHVSRGPLREAIRMLQSDGLAETQVNRQARVTPISIEELEPLYSMRIVAESLALQVSVPRFDRSDVENLRGLLALMEALGGHDITQWRTAHREFHLALVGRVGEQLIRTIREMYDHTERYRSLYIQEVPVALSIAAGEHKKIVEGCEMRDATSAAAHLARHLARAALTVLAHHAPTHDPALLRAAITMATGDDTASASGIPHLRRRLQ
jgi:DNA-binding GntR family transcriptional regulator